MISLRDYKIILMSASPRRLEILHNLGYVSQKAGYIADIEKDEDLIEEGEPLSIVKEIAERKLNANLSHNLSDDKCVYLVADTVCSVSYGFTQFVINKCCNEHQVRIVFDMYRQTGRVRISTYEIFYMPDSENKRYDFSGEAEIEFTDNALSLLTDDFIDEYIRTGRWKDRAGGIDFDYFSQRGFAFSGDESTIKGLAPFCNFL